MKRSSLFTPALALALGLCASAALATTTTPVSEDFEGDAFASGVNGVTTNNLTWADTEGYTAVSGGKLVVDAADTPTSATIDNTVAGNINGAFGRNAKFNATVTFVPATEAPTVADTNNDLKFALYALANGASTNLCVLADGGSQTVTALSSVADQEIEIAFTAANTFTVAVNGGSPSSAFTFKNTGSISKLEFQGNGDVDTLSFSYNLVDTAITWPTTMTVASYTVDGGESVALVANSGSATVSTEAGAAIVLTLTNADGATKTVNGTAGTAIDATAVTFGWAEYLGAAVDGAYQIDNLEELVRFQKGFAAGLATAGETFKLTADIALVNPWPGVGTYDNTTNADAFEGTFDGAGHRISNVLFADNLPAGGAASSSINNYRGFFNQVYNATIKDLTVVWNGWQANVATTEFGGAALVGCANNSTLLRLTAEGTIASGAHNNAGIVVRASGLTSPTTISCCTNKMAITGNYTKVAGICALTQSGTSTVTFDACVNEGAITAATAAGLANAGRDGLAGILAYAANGDGKTIINNCVNAGTINGASGFSGSHSGYTGAKAGQLVGWVNNSVSLTGANTVKDDYLAVGAYSSGKTTGQNFATVSGTTATMVADANVAAGATQYKAMTEKAAFTFAAAGTLIVDEALKAATVTAPGLVLSSATSGTVKTYTARAYATPTVTVTGGANATAAWTVNGATVAAPATLTEGDTYSVTYTANEGYEFDGGTATYMASGTAGTENITIVIPDAVASIIPYETNDDVTVAGGTHDLTSTEADYLNDLVEAKGGTAAAQAAIETALEALSEQDFAEAALLNQDITETGAGSYTFGITSITKDNGTITVQVTLQPSGKLLGTSINGTAYLYAYTAGGWVKQEGKTFTFAAFTADSPEARTAEVTFTGASNLFKVVIE